MVFFKYWSIFFKINLIIQNTFGVYVQSRLHDPKMTSNKGNIDVIIEDLTDHPYCPHGPTILFSRNVNGTKRNFFACAAYRTRKYCNFFLWQDERNKLSKLKKDVWKMERKNYLKNINHRKKFVMLNKLYNLPSSQRIYCNTCSLFVLDNSEQKHNDHNLLKQITDYQINHPSEILPSLEDNKKEAQYLFSKSSIETIVVILKNLRYKKVICIGTPTLHEYIRHECKDITSILLDIDSRFHNFFGPLEYCWYNIFNNHFFFDEARNVFKDFLKCNNDEDMVLISDPPFGGRVEPLAFTFMTINEEYKKVNNAKHDLPIFWVFPYFMEPQIFNRLPNFKMLDYKVEYDNHTLFHNGPRGRKQGSPVRIFTNLDLGLIKLPEDNYRFCGPCNRWVSKENNHCYMCNSCPSKDGRTYVHCSVCNRCVKPTWIHCITCDRCAQVKHNCGVIEFCKECFHCKEIGHKKSECPQLSGLIKKRKISKKTKSRKKRKC